MLKNKQATEQAESAVRIAAWYRGRIPTRVLGFTGQRDKSWQKLGTLGLILKPRHDAFEQAVIAGTLIGEATASKEELPALTKEVQLICILRLLSQYCSLRDSASYLINCITEPNTEHFKWFGNVATKVVSRILSVPVAELELHSTDWLKIGMDVAEILQNWSEYSIKQ